MGQGLLSAPMTSRTAASWVSCSGRQGRRVYGDSGRRTRPCSAARRDRRSLWGALYRGHRANSLRQSWPPVARAAASVNAMLAGLRSCAAQVEPPTRPGARKIERNVKLQVKCIDDLLTSRAAFRKGRLPRRPVTAPIVGAAVEVVRPGAKEARLKLTSRPRRGCRAMPIAWNSHAQFRSTHKSRRRASSTSSCAASARRRADRYDTAKASAPRRCRHLRGSPQEDTSTRVAQVAGRPGDVRHLSRGITEPCRRREGKGKELVPVRLPRSRNGR